MENNNLERFWAKVEKTESCWNWLGGKFWNGYGQFWLNNKVVKAHRFSFELAKGEIPENFVIDHLCRNRSCVNPEHLELVSNKENILRGNGAPAIHAKQTHCVNGHLLMPENVRKNGARFCRICEANRGRESYQRKLKNQNKQ